MKDYLSNSILNNSNHSLFTIVPERQLKDQSVQIIKPGKDFKEWSKKDHLDSYFFMQRIAQAWKSNQITDQYFIYGKTIPSDFKWEMIPYKKKSCWLTRIIQQIVVLIRVVFGGRSVSKDDQRKQVNGYKTLLEKTTAEVHKMTDSTLGQDAFCKKDVIERQWVVTGEKINVLFNYAPIGLGGQRLHFLIVPKVHREAFTDVTEEEYCEAMNLSEKLITHFMGTRENIKNAYLFNRTGKDAGQAVDHWLMHLVFSDKGTQDYCGKWTVFKNIVAGGSSSLKAEELKNRVTDLRNELTHIKASINE
jgi:diadenosine tetraphosphate (Ap4A) HIT family hydrolase